MTKVELESALVTIADKAESLRKAGVTSLSIGDISITLAPHLPETKVSDDDQTEDVQPKSALDDPMTYGRRREVPGRQRREDPNG